MLRQPQVGTRETRVATLLVVGEERSRSRRPRDEQRNVEARAIAANCRANSCTTSGSSMIESTRSLRPRSSTRPIFESRAGSARVTAASAPSPATASIRNAVRAGSAIATTRASISSRSRSTTSSSRRRQVELADERLADLLHRLELLRPARSPTRRAARSRSRLPPAPRAASTSSSSSSSNSAPPSFSVR